MIKLLATDLDGTLLAKGGILPDESVEYILKARQRGVHVVICSGRSINPLEHFCKLAGLYGPECYAIGYNGGLTFETGSRRVIRDIRLKPSLARKVEEAFNAFDVESVAYVFDRLLATSITERTERYSKLSFTSIEHVPELSGVGESLSKMLATGTNQELLLLEKRLNEILEGECNIFMTSPTLLEVTALGADKGSGVAFLAEHLGIDMNEVISMGDYDNDLQMLEVSGTGVAVANATDQVKAIADYITEADNNQCAIVEVIKKFILC